MQMSRPDKWDRYVSVTNSHSMMVYIGLGTTCNLDCLYCPKFVHDGKMPWHDVDKLMAVLEQVRHHYQWKRTRVYTMLGGEPTLMAALPDLCQRIKAMDDGARIQLATNGTRTPRYWERISPYLDQVIVSLHVSQIDIAQLNQGFKVLVENGVHVTTNVLMDQAHFAKAMHTAQWLTQQGWTYYITMKPVETMLGSNQLQDYTAEQREIIQSWGEDQQYSRMEACKEIAVGRKILDEDLYRFCSAEGEISDLNNFQGVSRDWDRLKDWHCFLNADKITIRNEGIVGTGDTCDQGAVLGNFYESDPATWAWTMAPVQCKRDRCVCGGDLDSHKFKHRSDADAYAKVIADRLSQPETVLSRS